MSSFKDLTGQTFGHLLVLRRIENNRHGQVCYEARCDRDGNLIKVVGHSLTRKNGTQSCGCLQKEITGQIGRSNRRHGYTVKEWRSEYNSYIHAKSRVTDPKDAGWHRYGGRGIRMCDRWLYGEGGKTGLECFIADMGPKPSPKHELDRWPDNDGNYEPWNCRWATDVPQSNNRRNNRKITAFGVTANLGQWARLFWMDVDALRDRLDSGLEPERALLEQGGMKNRIVTSDDPFEERAEWMHRFLAAAERRPFSPLPIISRDDRRACFKGVWGVMDTVPIRQRTFGIDDRIFTPTAAGHRHVAGK